MPLEELLSHTPTYKLLFLSHSDINRGTASLGDGIHTGGSDAGQIFLNPRYANQPWVVSQAGNSYVVCWGRY